jgi:TfoX/Sxy family transcriptional regulator of competence genes
VPYDEDLAARVRDNLQGTAGLTERAMFGGVTFVLHGNMCCGVINDNLVLRLGADDAGEALSQPFTLPMDFTGRPMNGYVYVAPAGTTGAALSGWLRRAVTFAGSRPPKPAAAARHAAPRH